MIKNPDILLSKLYTTPKKAINCFFDLQVVILIALVVVTSASAVAQSSVNYDLPQNWMCHPILRSTDIARQQSLTLAVLSSDLTVDTYHKLYRSDHNTGVDIFYVYPTIDLNQTSGNTSMSAIDTNAAKFVYTEQVGIYAQFGRVFVPYYQQATIGVFMHPTPTEQDKLQQADYMETAYLDIEAAFDNYLEKYNMGNKIILMGHSQGADLMRFLLRKKFDNNPALLSKLVVAISGGEPNYSAIGSRTGGSLEHIKTLSSEPESGCMISWRTWESGHDGLGLDSVSFFYNHYFADKGLLYQTYDKHTPCKHQDSNYDFNYLTNKPVTRYISVSPDSTQYWGFDDMFNARFSCDATKPGCTYLMIETNSIPNDLRIIPNPKTPPDILFPEIPIPDTSSFSHQPNINYHCWDMQFVQGDLLLLLPQLIDITNPIGIPENNHLENNILIYPNPTTDIVHLSNLNSKIESIRLCNLQGKLIQEFFTNDFSVSNLSAGIYYIIIQTGKSTFTHKLVKQ